MEGLIIFKSKLPENKKAFTLIEVLIDLMVVTMVAIALISGYVAAFKSISLASAKMVAVSLANEKMEVLRNISYDDLATQHGGIYPPGNIVDSEIVNRNGSNLNIQTVISYVDDPFDGNATGTIAGKPKDPYPYDYKKVEIIVGKVGKISQLARLVTNVSAKAAETPSNTGILSLCVIDSASKPVTDANVSVTNTTLTPPADIAVITGADGCIMLPKLPPDEHNNYHVFVTKAGYSTSLTYPRTDQNPNALAPDVNIIVQQVTSLTMVIDKFSSLEITFTDQDGAPVPNVNFTLESSKLIYFNPATYKYSQPFVTDSAGYKKIEDLEFDDYKVINVSPDYLISVSTTLSIHLPAATNLSATAVLSSSSTNPSISSYSPKNGVQGDKISITVDGGNFNSGTTIKLINAISGVEIVGSNVEIHPHSQIIADFDLTNAELGEWNLIITNGDGESVSQTNGFNITRP